MNVILPGPTLADALPALVATAVLDARREAMRDLLAAQGEQYPTGLPGGGA